ncbi:MAG: hypothetical protein H6707_14745 [Deltaproteobacteria bacterium]|nr:hypothetical protein [Deltaproteobacteria bacterium]
MKRIIHSLIFGALLTASGLVEADRGNRRPPHGKPPQQAFDACKGLKQGDRCTVDTPDGTLHGTCRVTRLSSVVHCVPDNHRPPRDRSTRGASR